MCALIFFFQRCLQHSASYVSSYNVIHHCDIYVTRFFFPASRYKGTEICACVVGHFSQVPPQDMILNWINQLFLLFQHLLCLPLHYISVLSSYRRLIRMWWGSHCSDDESFNPHLLVISQSPSNLLFVDVFSFPHTRMVTRE